MDNYSHAFLHGSVGYEAQEDKLERREDDIFAKPDLKPESAREQRRLRRRSALINNNGTTMEQQDKLFDKLILPGDMGTGSD